MALILLIGSFFISWSFAVLPFWVFLISVYILIDISLETRRLMAAERLGGRQPREASKS